MLSTKTFSILMVLSQVVACGGSSGYSGTLVDGMDGTGVADVRIVAKSSPPSSDLTCRVRETKSGSDGQFRFDDLCRNQGYIMSLPAATLHLSGTNTIGGSETIKDGKHQVWQAPDGQGVYRLSDDRVQPLPTFADVIRDQTPDGKSVIYPSLKPTGSVITIGKGQYLIVSGKNWIKRQKLYPLILDSGRRRLASGIITDHVFVGSSWVKDQLVTSKAQIDDSKVTDVLIRGEGVRFFAHDSVPAGRYALLGEDDARLTIVDFGVGQTPAK